MGRDTYVHHPVFARLYPTMGRAMERAGMTERRQALLARLTGQVIEVGAGDGLNFAQYPTTVARVLAVEPEPHLRSLARTAASQAPVLVEVVDGRAERLPAADATADAVVVSMVLCSVHDQDTALREMHRVLKPGGQLRFLEHVQADTSGLARVQRVLDATIWPRVAGGCHTGRDTAASIERSGFVIERLDRFLFPDARTPASFHILGTAVRSGSS
ncbi:class I SAM-dependent methyltransferase [Streptomyces thermospinosisporus]|uniref:Class I SAM-dependent methyltransferase n=1 Tax=Streptomyces thermospinosisporus TaxID=161482 RepID=A0ABN1Z5F4_9ACTN